MKDIQKSRTRIAAVTTAAVLAGAAALAGTAQAAVTTDTTALRQAVTVEGVMDHLEAFQAIADANDGNRAAGTPGHDASVDYVEGLLAEGRLQTPGASSSATSGPTSAARRCQQTAPDPRGLRAGRRLLPDGLLG